jgi:hypothetical protein
LRCALHESHNETLLLADLEILDMLGHAGLVFAQSDVRTVVGYMRDTFRDAEPQRLVATTDVGDISLDDPEQLLRIRARCSPRNGPRQDCTSRPTDTCDSLDCNPLGLFTEREIHSADKEKQVYRFMLQKQ